METKTCSKCAHVKKTDSFSIKSAAKDGLQSACKSCENLSSLKYRQANVQKLKDSSNKWRVNNSEFISDYQKRYRESNKNSAKEYRQAYYKSNKTLITKSTNEYKEKNKDYLKQKNREWVLRNPALRKNNAAKRRANKQMNGTFTILKKELIRLYASPCFYCKSTESIQADHVVPIAKGGRHSIGNLVPACSKCNQSKGSKLLIEWDD